MALENSKEIYMAFTRKIVFLSIVLFTTITLAGVFATGQSDTESTGGIPTLTVATHTGWAATLPPANNDLPVYQELERLSGVHIEWDNIQVGNYQEVMRARLAAGMDLPDLVNMSTLGDITKYGTDGLIVPLNDLIEKYATNIKRWFATPGNEIYKIQATSPDGNIYGVGNYVLPHYLSQGFLWNTTWLESVGIRDLPETQEEFLTALRAFRDMDPNGNGKKDEIPLTPAAGRGYLNVLGNMYGFENSIVTEFNVDDKGQVYWIFQDPRMKDYLTFMNMLYEEGLLDKAFGTDSWTETAEKVGNDVVGLITCWATFCGTYSGLHPAGTTDGSTPIFVNGPPIEGPYGDKYFVKRQISGGDEMAITKDNTQQEVSMKWIDFIRNSEEALMLQNFGIEGQTYNMVNGEIQTVSTPEKSFSAALLEVGGSQPPYAHLQWDAAWDFRFQKYSLDNDAKYQKYYRAPMFPQIRSTKPEQDVLDAKMTDLNTYKTEWFDKFVTGQESLERFDEFVAALDKLGAKEIVDVRQQQYERFLKLSGN